VHLPAGLTARDIVGLGYYRCIIVRIFSLTAILWWWSWSQMSLFWGRRERWTKILLFVRWRWTVTSPLLNAVFWAVLDSERMANKMLSKLNVLFRSNGKPFVSPWSRCVAHTLLMMVAIRHEVSHRAISKWTGHRWAPERLGVCWSWSATSGYRITGTMNLEVATDWREPVGQ